LGLRNLVPARGGTDVADHRQGAFPHRSHLFTTCPETRKYVHISRHIDIIHGRHR
jgi:hypothetical protein